MGGIADEKIPVFPPFFSNFGFRVQSLSQTLENSSSAVVRSPGRVRT